MSAVKKGLNKDTDQSQLTQIEYTHCLNCNTENEVGETVNITNEPSNYFEVSFTAGYKVIGYEKDLLAERTYYFLTNPETKKSSIGYVNEVYFDPQNIDEYKNCKDCEGANLLDTPLEQITQTPFNNYIELVNDLCHEVGEGLNFDINFPIKHIEIKSEKLGTIIYWTDYYNEPRWMNVTDISYLYTEESVCDEDVIVDCILIHKLLQFPQHTIPQIEATLVQTGGSLKLGTYEFYPAYCDVNGNEITRYFTPTNPVSIFDENNTILEQTQLDAKTNYAIKLTVNNLDTRFKYYKIVCVERTNVANTQSAFLEGIHPTTDNTILYITSGSNSDDFVSTGNVSLKRRVEPLELLKTRPFYEKTRGLVATQDRMFQWGLKVREEINLQPVVNLFGSLLKWQSTVAKEALFKYPIATSKYKGWMRDEVQPFGLRFLYKDGDYSSVFPLVGRPATEDELEVVDINDENYKSVSENAFNCITSGRNKKWQIYNTATVIDYCTDIEEGGKEIYEDVTKSCIIEDVFTIPAGSISFQDTAGYTNLEDFVEDNYEFVTDPDNEAVYDAIGQYLLTPSGEDPYPDDHCNPSFGTIYTSGNLVIGKDYIIYSLQVGDDFSNVGFTTIGEVFTATAETPNSWVNSTEVTQTFCNEPVFESFLNDIGTVVNEVNTFIEKEENEYLKGVPPAYCSMLLRNDEDGGFVEDESFQNRYINCIPFVGGQVYKRDFTAQNITCAYATDLYENPTVNVPGLSFFHNYYGEEVLADLLTDKDGIVDASFNNKIHIGALFFRFTKNGDNTIIFEVTKTTNCNDPLPDEVSDANLFRYTIYEKCSDTTPFIDPITMLPVGGVFDPTVGIIKIIDATSLPDTFYVAIDTPIFEVDPCIGAVAYRTSTSCGCFSAYTRPIEYSEVVVSWDEITIDKTEKYVANCKYVIPEVTDCGVEPYAYGDFSYIESTEEYDGNKELFDSSVLKVNDEDLLSLGTLDRQKFKSYFSTGDYQSNGDIVWKDEVDLRCKPIRHFKFPDNTVSPFMSDMNIPNFAESYIFPLGIMLDNSVVNTMLQIALKNNLLTQKQLDNISGYEIMRGDNAVSKSVIANGLAYDMYKYDRDGETYQYANYPFNDLGEDLLHTTTKDGDYIEHPYSGNKNNMYSFISPDLFLTEQTLPTESVLTGYQIGKADGRFAEVEDHPKWTILGRKARSTATTLATVEVILERLIKVAELTSQQWFTAGTSSGLSLGLVGAAIAAGAYAASGFVDVGRYRYEWLKIYRDTGAKYNFANYSVAHGFYNKFSKNSDYTQYLRGLSVRKYLKDGRFTFIDETKTTDNKINVNNHLREKSVFLSLGDYFYEYDLQYQQLDNNVSNPSQASRTIASKNDCATNSSYVKNIGSPQITLKNFIPDQFGTIDSITWLTTNYSAKLEDDTACKPILGGTVSISRFTWKRKTPMFTTTAMGQPDKTPFNYSPYKNIGYPKYYCDYEVDSEYTSSGLPFPDIDSDYVFDCQSPRDRLYIRPDSKFYLYYYGIVDFLVESEINCNFRYGRRDLKDQFYPQVGNIVDWTQEKNLTIKEPNTFFYNEGYSYPVSKTPFKRLDGTYNKLEFEKRSVQDNAIIYSDVDTNENELVDPYLIYKPLNRYEAFTKYGKLIALKGLESQQLLGRFENQQVIYNAVDNLADRITPTTSVFGSSGIFATRPLEFQLSDLGYGGTQHTDMLSTPYGHFSVDAKRGKVFMLDQSARRLEPISDRSGQNSSNIENWFREHLPFTIKKIFKDVDIDNKFKDIGISMGWDSRFDRAFITKKDYKPLNDCIAYAEGIGFYNSCTSATIKTCKEGYSYNETTSMCERQVLTEPLCPSGYTYDLETQSCHLITVTPADCDDQPRFQIPLLISCANSAEAPLINITGMTPADAKCTYEDNNFRRVYVFPHATSTTLMVGMPLYVGNVGSTLTSVSGTTMQHGAGDSPGTPPNGTEIIITITAGIVTAVTPFSTLPVC